MSIPPESEPGKRSFPELESQGVIVRDVRMPFLSMVVFMVKWALASIPAIIVLVAIGVAVAFFSWTSLALLSGVATQTRHLAGDSPRRTEAPPQPRPVFWSEPTRDTSTQRAVPKPPAADYIRGNVTHSVDVYDAGYAHYARARISNQGKYALRTLHGVLRCFGPDGELVSQTPYTVKDLGAGENREVLDEILNSVSTVQLEFGGGVLR